MAAGPGTIIGRYQLFEPLGAGGMATVFLARQHGSAGFSRLVAVKRLHPHLARSAEIATLFLDEARLAARVRHPSVVETLDVVREGRELLLVLELVEGATLAKLLRGSTPMSPAIAARIVVDALAGLEAVHQAVDVGGVPLGIIHRDVSPQNVLVGVDGRARMLDFGIAKAVGQSHVTRPGDVRGKLAYMAPEQLRGAASASSDLYAMAAILWELVAGVRLRMASNDAALVGEVLYTDAPELPAAAGAPPGLAAFLGRALSRDVGARPSSARAMAAELAALIPPASAEDVAREVATRAAAELAMLRAAMARIEAVPGQPPSQWVPGDVAPSALAPSIPSTDPAPVVPPPVTAPTVIAPAAAAPANRTMLSAGTPAVATLGVPATSGGGASPERANPAATRVSAGVAPRLPQALAPQAMAPTPSSYQPAPPGWGRAPAPAQWAPQALAKPRKDPGMFIGIGVLAFAGLFVVCAVGGASKSSSHRATDAMAQEADDDATDDDEGSTKPKASGSLARDCLALNSAIAKLALTEGEGDAADAFQRLAADLGRIARTVDTAELSDPGLVRRRASLAKALREAQTAYENAASVLRAGRDTKEALAATDAATKKLSAAAADLDATCKD